MILYLDTSALVPLLLTEAATPACIELWDRADSVIATRLTYVEAAAAIAMAQRLGRYDARTAENARSELIRRIWPEIGIVDLTDDLTVAAAGFAQKYGLRGYDSVHCAAAISLADDDLVAASGDAQMLKAWQAEGVAVSDVHRASPPISER